jgi:hypothetical protein
VTWGRAWLILFGLGATLGVALDGIHTHFGATEYTVPVVFRMAWWVPLLFGNAFTIGLLAPLLDRRPPRGNPVLAMAAFAGAYWLSVLPLPGLAVAAVLCAVFVVAWWVFDRTAVGLAIALAAAVGGPAVESFLVSQGLFRHLSVLAFGVPAWLPALYLNAAVGLTTLARRLVCRHVTA